MSTSRSRRSSSRKDDSNAAADDAAVTYEGIIGQEESDAANSLSTRLQTFRKWLTSEAKATVHSAICVVNGEATDGTRNAPVLVFEAAPESANQKTNASERLGVVDGEQHQALYDRTMGCQIRTVREVKKDETIMTIPRKAMITPDLVASSDAGKAILACCKAPEGGGKGFWDAFENTTICANKLSGRAPRSNGPQILVKILQERKKAEQAFKKHSEAEGVAGEYRLAEPGTISTRAPLLAFLIHQRFSNGARPLVSGDSFEGVLNAEDGNALRLLGMIQSLPDSLETFAPYARTLPSSVAVPLCWTRSELAVLTGCLPGVPLLQDVATSTMQLVSEFMALLNAGLLKRFPGVFPEGLITWERWVWAAAIVQSRNLPASCYVDDGVDDIASFKPENPLEFQSPADIWNELGVMIPLLDMLNHETEANQITWQPSVPESDTNMPDSGEEKGEDSDKTPHGPRAIVHKKVRKGSELFTCYGIHPNLDLISQYGFALMNNVSDVVHMGWGLLDGVGGTGPPFDYTPAYEVSDDFVFESNDEKVVNRWWSEDRIALLKQEALAAVDKSVVRHLESGKKLTMTAYNDGRYHPILLTLAVVATMPVKSLQKKSPKIVITSRHQVILQRYLEFTFSRKLEKLLQNLDNGLKGYFPGIRLWTKSSSGGLEYNAEAEESADGGSTYTSWQSFFDSHAYTSAMEVEKHYYALGTNSCVLTLYDGQLRALQKSIKSVSSDGKLSSQLVEQLIDLDFELGDEGEGDGVTAAAQGQPKAAAKADDNGSGKKGNATEEVVTRSPRRRRNRKSRNSSSGGKPPALKLHVGNLSYKTTPSDLYDYFCKLYGEDNVLECHIPTERDSGRSRGFGFVAMPEEVAMRVLQAGKKHEVGGRAVKIAKSNSVGSGSGNGRASEPPAPSHTDRCKTCGYRPKYCTCPGVKPPPGDRGPPVGPYGPGPDRPVDYGRPPPRAYEYYGKQDRYREERYRDYHDDYDRYGDYDRDRRSYRYGESSSRSYERSEDRRMRLESDRSRERSSSRSRRRDYDEGRSSRRDRRSDERRSEGSWERDRKRSRSRSRSRERIKKKKSKRRSRSLGTP